MLSTALGLGVAMGVSPYATVALLGLAYRIGWIEQLPALVVGVGETWVIVLAAVLTFIEFFATLVPGVASAWEAVHAIIRPPAAAALAVLVMWGGDPALVLTAGLLAGTLAFGTTLTKLGARLAIDTSPEPVSNGVANFGELTFVALIAIFVWQHPVIALVLALAIVATLALLVRAVWGLIWKSVGRARRRPGVAGLRS